MGGVALIRVGGVSEMSPRSYAPSSFNTAKSLFQQKLKKKKSRTLECSQVERRILFARVSHSYNLLGAVFAPDVLPTQPTNFYLGLELAARKYKIKTIFFLSYVQYQFNLVQ